MKQNLYKFYYTFEGQKFIDYVSAQNIQRAQLIFRGFYPNVESFRAFLISTVLI